MAGDSPVAGDVDVIARAPKLRFCGEGSGDGNPWPFWLLTDNRRGLITGDPVCERAAADDAVLMRFEFARDTVVEDGRDERDREPVEAASDGAPETRRDIAGERGAGRLEMSEGSVANEVDMGRLRRLLVLKVLNAGLEGPEAGVVPCDASISSRLSGIIILEGDEESFFPVAVLALDVEDFRVSGVVGRPSLSSGGSADVNIVGVVEEDVDCSTAGDVGGSKWSGGSRRGWC